MKIKISAPAKINLTLDILGKRPDNYHNVKMIMQAVSLYDYVTLEQTASGRITLECSDSAIPCDESNIAYKTADAFFERSGIQNGGLHIFIEKNIPSQAGLAGGSADGAAVLAGLNLMYNSPLSEDELKEAGSSVGADIPFCIIGGTALAKGTGTTLTRLEPMPECRIVLVKPPVGISTAAAYKAADSRDFIPESSSDIMLPLLGNIYGIAENLHNDFESVAEVRCIGEIKRAMLECGALGACMSGSGTAVFGIFDNEAAQSKCIEMLKSEYEAVFAVCPVNHGCIAQAI